MPLSFPSPTQFSQFSLFLQDSEFWSHLERKLGELSISHGHPIFSLDDKWILYNSKIGDTHNIYMTDVESI